MPNALEEAFDCCALHFDSPVSITTLLNDYQLTFEETQRTLREHLEEQEKRGEKFRKRYLVQGEDVKTNNFIYTIVNGEQSLQKLLSQLRNGKSSLYSVEIAGGSLPAAADFEPLRNYAIKLSNVAVRDISEDFKGHAYVNVPKTTVAVKSENAKTQPSTVAKSAIAATAMTAKSAVAAPATPAKVVNKKVINNFFGTAAASSNKQTTNKDAAVAVKKPVQDFFKKQTEKTLKKDVKLEKNSANTSLQLFETANVKTEKANESISVLETSDEEQPLPAAKRAKLQADVAEQKQPDDDDEEYELQIKRSKSKTIKKRRILDSDDEQDAAEVDNAVKVVEQPQQKEECSELPAAAEAVAECETYLDEDGFVVTKRSNKSTARKTAASQSKAAAVSPNKTAKTPKKNEKKSPKKMAAAKSKTKQGNIMNFFSKK